MILINTPCDGGSTPTPEPQPSGDSLQPGDILLTTADNRDGYVNISQNDYIKRKEDTEIQQTIYSRNLDFKPISSVILDSDDQFLNRYDVFKIDEDNYIACYYQLKNFTTDVIVIKAKFISNKIVTDIKILEIAGNESTLNLSAVSNYSNEIFFFNQEIDYNKIFKLTFNLSTKLFTSDIIELESLTRYIGKAYFDKTDNVYITHEMSLDDLNAGLYVNSSFENINLTEQTPPYLSFNEITNVIPTFTYTLINPTNPDFPKIKLYAGKCYVRLKNGTVAIHNYTDKKMYIFEKIEDIWTANELFQLTDSTNTTNALTECLETEMVWQENDLICVKQLVQSDVLYSKFYTYDINSLSINKTKTINNKEISYSVAANNNFLPIFYNYFGSFVFGIVYTGLNQDSFLFENKFTSFNDNTTESVNETLKYNVQESLDLSYFKNINYSNIYNSNSINNKILIEQIGSLVEPTNKLAEVLYSNILPFVMIDAVTPPANLNYLLKV